MNSALVPAHIVVLGTGGTIAGTAASPDDVVGYTPGRIAIGSLVAGIELPAHTTVECEQVAQIDSRSMTHAIWQTLARRVAHHLARPEVTGVVITHGTDTLEETAWFLQRVLAPHKPVVLTGAMRPATAALADGPQNLSDAITVVREPGEPGGSGVLAVLAGALHDALHLRKAHPLRLDDAFDSGEVGPLGLIAGGRVRWLRLGAAASEQAAHAGAASHPALRLAVAEWPRVEIVASHAGASGAVVHALCEQGVAGLVVSATGNGSVHAEMQAALVEAQASGVAVLCSPRYGDGCWNAQAIDRLPLVDVLTPAKARVELMIRLMESVQR